MVQSDQYLINLLYFLQIVELLRTLKREMRVRLQCLDVCLPHAQKLVGVHSDDEFWGLLAHEQLPEFVCDPESDDEDLFFADVDAFVGAGWL